MKQTLRSNGKLQGVIYTMADGRKIFLAHRTRRQVYREKNAWCFERYWLNKCKEQGVVAVGVVVREGRKKAIWLTPIDDLFDSPFSFAHYGNSAQRGLPVHHFRINPDRNPEVITAAIKLG